MKANNDIKLGTGAISFDTHLGSYYQDFVPAAEHIDTGSFASLDEDGVPYTPANEKRIYNAVMICQYALIQFELLQKEKEPHTSKFKALLNWLDDHAESFDDKALVWRTAPRAKYGLHKPWVSAMTQGHIISVYLRAYQLFGEKRYLEHAEKAFEYLHYDYADGGVQRIDENGYLWLEEYPSEPASYVLNGYIYALFGVLDLYRVTKSEAAKKMYDEGIRTLEDNIHRYHRWYWSSYDLSNKELVSYYYQKNVHIPLVKILFMLTENPLFDIYYKKWSKQLDSPISKLVVPIMYRIQPRLPKIQKNK
jgi:hypothetical protein